MGLGDYCENDPRGPDLLRQRPEAITWLPPQHKTRMRDAILADEYLHAPHAALMWYSEDRGMAQKPYRDDLRRRGRWAKAEKEKRRG